MKKRALFVIGFGLSLFVGFLILDCVFSLKPLLARKTYSLAVTDRSGELLKAYLTDDDKWRFDWRGEEIPKNLLRILIPTEDRFFFYHPGVNPLAIARALVSNIKTGHVVSGGSTITMQVAKLLDPKPRRLSAKLIEGFRALQLEWHLSKVEILRLYLSLAPYGGNIEGIEAASRLYLGKSPEQLTLSESALLVAIPRNPNLYRPDLHLKEALALRERILLKLLNRGFLGEKEWREATAIAPRPGRFPLPQIAPHLSDAILLKDRKEGWVKSTIDIHLERQVESILAEYKGALYSQGITNAAVVVIENGTGKVRALVGSLDYSDRDHQGEVNGAMSPRSPGSTLKPFVYALAFDEGWLTPDALIEDVPFDSGGYQPKNFDGLFSGSVSVEESLIRSLNVPAVMTLNRLGWERFYAFLRKAQVSSLTRNRHRYGLSLILGGCEVSLLELTGLYSVLASHGDSHPVSYIEGGAGEARSPLLSDGASYLVSEILVKGDRPDLKSYADQALDIPAIAWKTGTSYGQKDAWSVGYNARYSIGVWVGNFNAAGNPNLVGVKVAAPLLFRLFNSLEKGDRLSWFVKPETVYRRELCALSGRLPTENCPRRKSGFLLSGRSQLESCAIHRGYDIEGKTGYRLCSYCRSGREFVRRVIELWSAPIANWRREHGYPVDEMPEHLQSCGHRFDADPPRMISPKPNETFILRDGIGAEGQKILLQGEASPGVQTLYWFVDDVLLFSGFPGERFFWTPKVGRFKLALVDSEGGRDEQMISVK